MHVSSHAAAALAMFLMHVAVTDGFALAPLGSARRLCSRRWVSSRGPHMQVQQWIEAAATSQGRDPVRLEPLKPLPDVIQIRTLQKPDFAGGEMPYAEGLLGIGQKMNAGDWGPDMQAVKKLCREVGGYGDQEIFQMSFLGQGYRSFVVAEDTRTGDIVACAQLTRIQVGGYLYLTDDLQIQHVMVKEEYRRLGIANHMKNTLLQRVKPNQRAWAWADRETEAFYSFFASGFVGITYQECGRVFPFILWLLLWPFHRVGLTRPDVVFFAAEGRGGMDAYNQAG